MTILAHFVSEDTQILGMPLFTWIPWNDFVGLVRCGNWKTATINQNAFLAETRWRVFLVSYFNLNPTFFKGHSATKRKKHQHWNTFLLGFYISRYSLTHKHSYTEVRKDGSICNIWTTSILRCIKTLITLIFKFDIILINNSHSLSKKYHCSPFMTCTISFSNALIMSLIFTM